MAQVLVEGRREQTRRQRQWRQMPLGSGICTAAWGRLVGAGTGVIMATVVAAPGAGTPISEDESDRLSRRDLLLLRLELLRQRRSSTPIAAVPRATRSTR